MPRQPRKEFSARTKREARERANGFCEGMTPVDCGHAPPVLVRCGVPLDRGYHYDHISPDWFSSDNTLENCQVLCRECHKRKTAGDVKDIAKSKRIIDKRTGVRRKTKFRGWRNFKGGIVWAK